MNLCENKSTTDGRFGKKLTIFLSFYTRDVNGKSWPLRKPQKAYQKFIKLVFIVLFVVLLLPAFELRLELKYTVTVIAN